MSLWVLHVKKKKGGGSDKRTEAPFGCSASIWHEPVGLLLTAHQRAVKTNKTKPFPFAHPLFPVTA